MIIQCCLFSVGLFFLYMTFKIFSGIIQSLSKLIDLAMENGMTQEFSLMIICLSIYVAVSILNLGISVLEYLNKHIEKK